MCSKIRTFLSISTQPSSHHPRTLFYLFLPLSQFECNTIAQIESKFFSRIRSSLSIDTIIDTIDKVNNRYYHHHYLKINPKEKIPKKFESNDDRSQNQSITIENFQFNLNAKNER